MLEQAVIITLLGMGSVFVFLLLLICALNILRLWASGNQSKELAKIAVAIAVAKRER